MKDLILRIVSGEISVQISIQLVAAIIAAIFYSAKFFLKLREEDKVQRYNIPQSAYQDRLSNLLDNLRRSSADFDAILHEMSSVATSREEAVRKLEMDLIDLENKEKEIKDRVENLKNVPLPVADHLAKLMEPEGKKSAKRDYLLFLSGVIVSTVIAIILEIYFKA